MSCGMPKVATGSTASMRMCSQAVRAMGAPPAETGPAPDESMPRLLENGGLGDAGREACDRRDFAPASG